MSQPLYIVTGRNRLTGVREQCSMAAPKDVVEQFMQTWKRSRKRNKPYTHLRKEPYYPSLNFNAKQKKTCLSK